MNSPDAPVELSAWRAEENAPAELLHKEWIITNGLGGYASGTLGNVNIRRYHGVLIAALPSPHGRMLMLKQVEERVRVGDRMVHLSGAVHEAALLPGPYEERLAEFRLEQGLPVWRYRIEGIELEKRLVMPHGQNTVSLIYRLLAGEQPVEIDLRPSMHFRPHEGRASLPVEDYAFTIQRERCEVTAGQEQPSLRMRVEGHGNRFVWDRSVPREMFFRVEAERGYDPRGVLWNPGYFSFTLQPGRYGALTASTEPWHVIEALSPTEILDYEAHRRTRMLHRVGEHLRRDMAGQLVLAADQFIISPAGRVKDAIRAHAEGDEVRTVIAGYHWFTDWGRDTMISLEGLTLTTGRHEEAAYILRTFADYVRDGLIPNMFPEKGVDGLYHTADATLWYFHAVDRFVTVTGNRELLRDLLPILMDICDHHVRGTRFGIRADPADGLLKQGLEGYQLTWMDAKVGDWVVTPRRGKAVEINALWYNALCLMNRWLHEEGQPAPWLEALAEKVRVSFNDRFWYESGRHLFDVVDGEFGDDPACRPNQIFAFSLPNPVLDKKRWRPVLQAVEDRLLTPLGLRSLDPGHPDYKRRYFGDLHARDAAYHQGTVWGWLIGPFVDAWLRVHPGEGARARQFLEGFAPHLSEAGIGTISEIFDADAPYTPRGCIAQAWSVAEVLRCLEKVESLKQPAPE